MWRLAYAGAPHSPRPLILEKEINLRMSFGSLISISWSAFYRRKIIEVKIIDDEEYEKNKSFTIELGEPILLEIGQKHGGCPCA